MHDVAENHQKMFWRVSCWARSNHSTQSPVVGDCQVDLGSLSWCRPHQTHYFVWSFFRGAYRHPSNLSKQDLSSRFLKEMENWSFAFPGCQMASALGSCDETHSKGPKGIGGLPHHWYRMVPAFESKCSIIWDRTFFAPAFICGQLILKRSAQQAQVATFHGWSCRGLSGHRSASPWWDTLAASVGSLSTSEHSPHVPPGCFGFLLVGSL